MLPRSLLALSLVTTLTACSHSSNSSSNNSSAQVDKQTQNSAPAMPASAQQILSQEYDQVFIKCQLQVASNTDSFSSSLSETLLQPRPGEGFGSVTALNMSYPSGESVSASLTDPTFSVEDGVVTVEIHGQMKLGINGDSESQAIDGFLILANSDDQSSESSYKTSMAMSQGSSDSDSQSLSLSIQCAPEYKK